MRKTTAANGKQAAYFGVPAEVDYGYAPALLECAASGNTMTSKLAGKVALVTGGSAGSGSIRSRRTPFQRTSRGASAFELH